MLAVSVDVDELSMRNAAGVLFKREQSKDDVGDLILLSADKTQSTHTKLDTSSSCFTIQEEKILLLVTMGLWCCLPKFAIAFCVFLFPLVVKLWQKFMGNQVNCIARMQDLK